MKNFIPILKKMFLPANIATMIVLVAGLIVTFTDTNTDDKGLATQKTIVILLGLIITTMLFERIGITDKTSGAIASMLESIQTLLTRSESSQEFILFQDDSAAREVISKISHSKPLKRVEILSSGLTSRQELIPMWLNMRIPVDALVQDFETALDNKDKGKVLVALDWICRQSPGKLNLLTLKSHINISTIRAIILHETNTQTKHIFLSWYYYYDTNKKIEGVGNPTLYCSTSTKPGKKTYEWLNKVIEINLQESKPVNIMELLGE
jgi:hypothetical protein